MTGTRLKLPLPNASANPCGKIVVPAVGDVLMLPCAASESCKWGVAQARGNLRIHPRAADRGCERNTQGFLGRDRSYREQHIGAALDDRGAEKSLRGWRGQIGRGAEPAGQLAADRHPVRVSTEMLDVVADPFECELLVHQPVIAGDSIAVQGRVGQPAERAEAIIDGHDDDVLGAMGGQTADFSACSVIK